LTILLIGLNSLSFARTKGVLNTESAGSLDAAPASLPGLIYVADSGNQRVQVFSIDGVYQNEFDHSFYGPSGIALYGRSRVYVKGNENCEADEFSGNGGYLLHFGGCANGQTGLGIFDNLGSMAISGDEVWITSPDFYYFQKADSSGNFLAIVCMDRGVTGCLPATKFFVQPYGIALDPRGNIYVTNIYPTSFDIVKFDNKGNYLFSFGSNGSGNGQFNYPEGIAVDADGNIYVVDTANNRIQKFDKNGVYQSQFGSLGSGDGELNFPSAIAFDASGDIYVTDEGNNRVEKFDSQGVYQSQFGSYGQGTGQFYGPSAIAITK
jgi:DNA-binding beta-propeller fold protein YncE